MEAFPEAKVVLSVRNPQTWYKSVYDSIYNFHILREDPAACLFGRLTGYMRNMECADEISLHPPQVVLQRNLVRTFHDPHVAGEVAELSHIEGGPGGAPLRSPHRLQEEHGVRGRGFVASTEGRVSIFLFCFLGRVALFWNWDF